VVFYTAHYGQSEAMALALAGGASCVLMKPAEPEEVLRIVNRALSAETATAIPSDSSLLTTEFDREHLRLLTDKLSEKAADLGAVNTRLRALIEIGLEVASERDSGRMLARVSTAARELFRATYVTLGIVEPSDRTVRRFVVCGEAAATGIKAGDVVSGILATVVAERRTVRGDNASGSPAELQLPALHPEVRAFVAAPIASPSHVYGWILLVGNEGRIFTENDEQLAMLLAGQVGCSYELAGEIHDRQQAERVACASEEHLQLALEAADMVTFDWSLTNNQIIWSPGHRTLAWPGAGALGDTYETFGRRVHPDDLPGMNTEIERCIAARAPLAHEFRMVPRQGGSELWVSVMGTVKFGDDGQAVQMRGVAMDITDRKLTAQALVEADRRKDEFLATLSHELRNPLAPIRFALDGLTPGASQAELTRAHGVIDRQVVQLTRLVDDLVDVSRITRNKIRLRRQPAALTDLMRSALEAVAPLAIAADHLMEIHFPSTPVWINGDGVRLIQVFTNVLNNAVKFTPRGGRICFSANAHDHIAVVHVRDNGIGIARDAVPRVFEMFHQEGRVLDRSTSGLGIGLALAHRLVEMHDGRIEIHSPGAGQGVDVEIRLPTTTATLVGTDRARPVRAQRALRVLIVDDNVDAADMLEVLVSSLGHTTQLAHDGPSTIVLAEAFAPDIILMDIGLPSMNGYLVAQELRRREKFARVHIAAVTGWDRPDDRRRAREAGFDSHLAKPVAVAALEDLLLATAQDEPYVGDGTTPPFVHTSS
jgi:signal transduction histidine kinase/CheY-like chemotaxis protein